MSGRHPIQSKEQLIDLLIAQFAYWQGDKNIPKIIANTLRQYHYLPFFHEAVVIFKNFINSENLYNPWRFTRKPILNNVPIANFIFQDSYRVIPTKTFAMINRSLDEAIQRSADEMIKDQPSIKNHINISGIEWKKIILSSLLLMSAPRVKAEPSASEALQQFKMSSQTDLLMCVDTQQSTFTNKIPQCRIPTIETQLLLEKIIIEPNYAAKLTPQERSEKRLAMLDFLMHLAEDAEEAEKLNYIFTSDHFEFKIVEGFEENPYGCGLYSSYRNQLFVKDKDKYFCSDFYVTVKHELHHAYVTNLKSDQQSKEKCKPLTEEQCDKFAEPFNSAKERKALETAIEKDDKMIADDLVALYKKSQQKQLSDPNEIKRYDQYKNILATYQPRCIAHLISRSQPNYHADLQKLKSGKAISTGKNQPNLYSLHYEVMPNGILVFGNYIKNYTNAEEKVFAFIEDGKYIKNNWRKMYDPSGKNPELLTTEYDAERNGDSAEITNAFYSYAKNYHTQFRRETLNKNAQQSLHHKQFGKSI